VSNIKENVYAAAPEKQEAAKNKKPTTASVDRVVWDCQS
jgi:hypothetical protein